MATKTKDRELLHFYRAVANAQRANPNWRFGQAFFNTLHEMRPDLSSKLRGSDLDPFYDDEMTERVMNAYAFVIDNW